MWGGTGAGTAINEVTNNFLGHVARNELNRLLAKKAAGQTLTVDENRQLVELAIADQMSDSLLAKFRSGAPLTPEEKSNLNYYLNGYANQDGLQATSNLIKSGSKPNYGFPYAGSAEAQETYKKGLVDSYGGGASGYLWYVVKGRPISQDEIAFNQAKRDAGMGGSVFGGVTFNEAYLPSRLTGNNLATLDALINSPVLGTAVYLGGKALGVNPNTLDNAVGATSVLSDVLASFVLPKTSASPVLGKTTAEILPAKEGAKAIPNFSVFGLNEIPSSALDVNSLRDSLAPYVKGSDTSGISVAAATIRAIMEL